MKLILISVSAVLIVLCAIQPSPSFPGSDRRLPGWSEKEGYLLPNGWRLTPAGAQVPLGDLPLALVLHPDGRHALVSNNGEGEQSVDVLDLVERRIVSSAVVRSAWLGLRLNTDGTRVYAGGGVANAVLSFTFHDGKLEQEPPIPIAAKGTELFPGGLCVAGQLLFVANNLGNSLTVIDLETRVPRTTIEVGDHPYTCVASRDGRRVFVSLWGAARVAMVDGETFAIVGSHATDDHPNAMLLSQDDRRLFVANANSNTISAIDLVSGQTTERVSITLYPNSPAGSTPNALALSPDGNRLYVANADNNDIAVIDVSRPGSSRVLGFIPAGWYPTALAVSSDGATLYVANGKGGRSFANPEGPQPGRQNTRLDQAISQLLKGTLSIIPVPDADALARYTTQVYGNVPYNPKTRMSVAFKGKSAIPRRVGGKSPIHYVIYIIKENRTYDQVLGDLSQGNGDPGLTLFGKDVTPNEHALARQFVLLDNFYADAEISPDGHNWSMGAYATDYVEKLWPSQSSGRRGLYDFEGAAIAAPSEGYIWDACKRSHVSYRSYGEWVMNGKTPADPAVAQSPALEGRIDPHYRGFDVSYSDLDRADRFLSELRRFEKEGDMPRLQIVRLGNDHTAGTRPGQLTPRSFVAQNDLALGRVIEGISHSAFWPRTAVFIVEDDAQSGPDHVDAHRTVALVASPFARRGIVDSTMYSTSSLLRSIELILGVPPMTQYDAAAQPMFACFGLQANPRAYTSLPARVSLTDRNSENAPGARRSLEMDMDEADAAPDLEFNEIIWKSVKGADSPMPAPVRAAFVRPIH